MDPGWQANHHTYLLEAQLSKYRTHADLLRILLDTGEAQLNHFVRGRAPVVCIVLMRARHELRAEQEATDVPTKKRRLAQ